MQWLPLSVGTVHSCVSSRQTHWTFLNLLLKLTYSPRLLDLCEIDAVISHIGPKVCEINAVLCAVLSMINFNIAIYVKIMYVFHPCKALWSTLVVYKVL